MLATLLISCAVLSGSPDSDYRWTTFTGRVMICPGLENQDKVPPAYFPLDFVVPIGEPAEDRVYHLYFHQIKNREYTELYWAYRQQLEIRITGYPGRRKDGASLSGVSYFLIVDSIEKKDP